MACDPNAYTKRSYSSKILKILNNLGSKSRTKSLCKSGGFSIMYHIHTTSAMTLNIEISNFQQYFTPENKYQKTNILAAMFVENKRSYNEIIF